MVLVTALCACVAVAGYLGARVVGDKVTAIGTEMLNAVKTDPVEIAQVVMGTRTETIRGQQVIITISESSGGRSAMRQWTAFFNGKGGQVVLMIQGTVAGWDDQLFLDFIHSIR